MRLTIIYPADILGPKVGGGESFLKGLIMNAPPDFEIEFIGVTSDPQRQLRKWFDAKLGEKQFQFFPCLLERNENKRKIIPLAFRFALALQNCKLDYSDRLLFFNRIEPAILFRNVSSPKMAVIHNDIEKQIKHAGSEVFWRRMPKLYFMLERHVFGFMSQVYTVSQNSVTFYKRTYPDLEGRISFLSTWLDDGLFTIPRISKAEIRNNLDFTDEDRKTKWILFVGRLQEQKAPRRLIDSFSHFLEKGEKARLVIIGEGNLKRDVEKYVNFLGLRDKVIFLKGMSQILLVKYYQAADVFLLTSNYEGMPMCVLEALGCGVPVVSTDVGEVSRIVKNGYSGEIAASSDPTVIAAALRQVLNNPEAYNQANCKRSVESYKPSHILGPVYEKMREILDIEEYSVN